MQASRLFIRFGFLVPLSLVSIACDDAGSGSSDAGEHGHAADGGGHAGGSGGSHAGAGGTSAGAGKGGSGQAGAAGHAGAGGKRADSSDAGGTSTEEVSRATVEADKNPSIDDAAYAGLVKQLNKVGLELGRRQEEANKLTEQNSVYSPLSAAYALSMTYAGARAETAKQMGSVLSGEISASTYHTGMNRLARELKSRALEQPNKAGNAQRIELNIADAVYVDKALTLQDDFLNELSRNYDSGVHREDFRTAFEPARMHINDWVAEQTHDKIVDLLPNGSVTDRTRLVLVNALYFYGSWRSAFSPEATRDAAFHALDGKTVDVPTMHNQLGLRYATGAGFAAVEVPYVGDHLRMTVVLPDAGQFETVRKAVSADWLAALHTSATSKTVSITLPKWKLTTGSFSLKQSLADMGMSVPFTDAADFTGISSDEPLAITDVVQKAFIAVDENGTEAAAATAATVGTTSAVLEVIPFAVDRPFLFFIQDDNGIVLFSGHVVNPA